MWEVFYILPQTTTLIHKSNQIKARALPTVSTPLYDKQSEAVTKHCFMSCCPSSLPLDHHAFPSGRLHLHSDGALQEGFPSLFLRPGPRDGKEPGHSDTLKGPAGPPWLMMTPWRKKVWPLNQRSISKGVSSAVLAAHGPRDQHWPSQPGLPSDDPEHC